MASYAIICKHMPTLQILVLCITFMWVTVFNDFSLVQDKCHYILLIIRALGQRICGDDLEVNFLCTGDDG